MNIEWILYLADVVDSLNKLLGLFFVSSIFFVFFNMIVYFYQLDELCDKKEKDTLSNKYNKTLFCCFKIALVIIFINILIPSSKTIYFMAGAHYLNKTNIPKKVELVLNKKLDEYLKEKTK